MKDVRLAFGLACALVTLPVFAQAHRVDDSGSQVLGGPLRLKPITPMPHGQLATALFGQTSVLVRLDVAPWKGRRGRIYMTLPQQADGQVVASWGTQGRLLPGSLRSGERTLVYAGPIDSDALEDTLRLSIQADGRELARDEQLAFSFEIDLDAP
ncbi:hypothetical protein FNZ56_04960 [Pseudoluteimonas lycopersici]|uniref:DUF4402 domain-containing protein n=1 Tax=Pseudoluteimonas lycopersici TaxID=1324796 RepID=A0A516V405_9GAMM|nr:hypothetical protein [Lysobacter lycopersici]QDQ73261.1 hypothetical protein FNZ56_04960 [Lysobacter lycopersici]